jgi:hypothetical protein
MKKIGKAGSTFGTVVAAAAVLAVATTGGAVAGGLVTSAKIKNNTIKSIDVRNNNLTGVDIADGSIGSADVADGSIGAGDLAGSARGFTNIVTKSVTVPSIANGTTSTRNVDCGAGKVAIGGGGYTSPSGIVLLGTTFGILEQSMPSSPSTIAISGYVPAGDNVAAQAWRTTVRNNDGSTTSNVHYAICASK